MLKEVLLYLWELLGMATYIPVFIVVVGNLDAYDSERDRHLFILMVLCQYGIYVGIETLGLSSCSINWPDIEQREKKMDKFLNLKNIRDHNVYWSRIS